MRAAQPRQRQLILFFFANAFACARSQQQGQQKSSHWVDQNTNLNDCLGYCWPLINFKVNLVKLLPNKFNFGNVVTTVSQGQSRRFIFSSCNGQCEGIQIQLLLLTASTFKNKTVESFLELNGLPKMTLIFAWLTQTLQKLSLQWMISCTSWFSLTAARQANNGSQRHLEFP